MTAQPRDLPSPVIGAVLAIVVGITAALAYRLAGGQAALAIAGAIVALSAAVLVLRRPGYGVIVMLLALPLDIAGRIIAEPVAVTVYHLSLLLMLASWTWAWLASPGEHRPRLSVLDIGMAALVGAAIWSLPGSLSPSVTLISITRLVFLWLFSLSVVNFVRSERDALRVVVTVVGTATASAALAFAQGRIPGLPIGTTHLDYNFGEVAQVRPSAFFEDPNLLGTFLSVAVIAALAKAIHARRWIDAVAWLGATVVCAVGLVVTLSRTAWVGVALGLVVLVLTAPRRRRVWLASAGMSIAVVAMIMAPGAIVSRAGSILDIERDSSIRTRYLMAGSTLEMISEEWVFGTGLGAYDRAYPAYRKPGALTSITKPHQLPLAMWAEMGILGLIAELLIVGGVVIVIRSRRHRGWNVYEALGVAGLLAVLLQSFFQYYLYFEYLWLFLALTVAATRFTKDAEEVSV
ncbi:MAG: O-antigen ligase family protein [Coriobacteriia bacterium]